MCLADGLCDRSGDSHLAQLGSLDCLSRTYDHISHKHKENLAAA